MFGWRGIEDNCTTKARGVECFVVEEDVMECFVVEEDVMERFVVEEDVLELVVGVL